MSSRNNRPVRMRIAAAVSTLAIALSCMIMPAAQAQQAVPTDIAPLLEREQWLNDKCRGGPGTIPQRPTIAPCVIERWSNSRQRAGAGGRRSKPRPSRNGSPARLGLELLPVSPASTGISVPSPSHLWQRSASCGVIGTWRSSSRRATAPIFPRLPVLDCPTPKARKSMRRWRAFSLMSNRRSVSWKASCRRRLPKRVRICGRAARWSISIGRRDPGREVACAISLALVARFPIGGDAWGSGRR